MIEIAKRLCHAGVVAGANVHTRNEKGETVLHTASAAAYTDIDINVLLAAGADPSARTKDH